MNRADNQTKREQISHVMEVSIDRNIYGWPVADRLICVFLRESMLNMDTILKEVAE